MKVERIKMKTPQENIKAKTIIGYEKYFDTRIVHKWEDLTPELQEWLLEEDEDLFYEEVEIVS